AAADLERAKPLGAAEGVRLRPELPEDHGAAAGGVGAGHFIYLAHPARDGGRSGTAVSGIGGGVGDSQGRTGGRAGRQVSFLCHRLWGPGFFWGLVSPLRPRSQFFLQRWPAWAWPEAGWASGPPARRGGPP